MDNIWNSDLLGLVANQNINQAQTLDDNSYRPTPEDKELLHQLVEKHIQDLREGKIQEPPQENLNLKKLQKDMALKNYDDRWKYYVALEKQHKDGIISELPYPPVLPMEIWEDLPPYNP